MRSLFAGLGLKEDAGVVYLASLELGESRAADIAKKAKLNRSVAYGLLDDLTNRGFVQVKQRSGVKQFAAEDPAVITRRFVERALEAQELLPGLSKLFKAGEGVGPKMRFYADFEGIRTVFEELLDNKSKHYRVIGSFLEEATEGIGKDFLEKWTRRRIKAGVSHRALRSVEIKKEEDKWNPIFRTRGKSALRDYRYAPFSIKLPALIFLFDDKIAFISGRLGAPYAAVVESKDLFQTLSELFEVIWTISEVPDVPLT